MRFPVEELVRRGREAGLLTIVDGAPKVAPINDIIALQK